MSCQQSGRADGERGKRSFCGKKCKSLSEAGVVVCASQVLTRDSLGKQHCFIMPVSFCGVDAPAVADFRLPCGITKGRVSEKK